MSKCVEGSMAPEMGGSRCLKRLRVPAGNAEMYAGSAQSIKADADPRIARQPDELQENLPSKYVARLRSSTAVSLVCGR